MSRNKNRRQETVKEKPVELGFIEEIDELWRLSSAYFSSKFGGSPSWLDLKDLPKPSEIKCGSCDGPTKFLLQIYAPLESEETFHRSIFLFVCPKPHCCVEKNSNKNWVAFRSQLKRQNEFYSSEPPPEDDSLADIIPEKFGTKLCRICGAQGPLSCGGCHKVNYCGKEHQTLDWKEGHKGECTDADFNPTHENQRKGYFYKESEIVIDKEVIPKAKSKAKSEKQRLEEYEKFVSEGQLGTLSDVSNADLQEAASYKSDKAFNKFRKRVQYQPDQILRYDRGGDPLWVSADKTMEKSDIPPCPLCEGPRVFEFQVMPQLLNHVGQDGVEGSLDWGTVVVYTCEKSCNSGPSYKPEFVWQQDFKEVDV
ncbi:unnamed protein product [Allacma fusca]|uniref:MYND-type domain-containing protein n=1 Tax=Allacma fusca TaxID=39272 RepID=A0A8J2KIR7_9HEXA|nr:unnamed protein product [Allacma fusca]